MGKLLIASFYSHKPVMLATTRLGPDELVLLVNEEADAQQEKSLKIMYEALKDVIKIREVKVKPYDVVDVAEKTVKIIDKAKDGTEVYINLTAGRKTMALGLLFGAYARIDYVQKIAYNPEEDKGSIVYLPKLGFNLTESQKKILDALGKGKYGSMQDLAEKIDISTAMLYRAVEELKRRGFVEMERGVVRLTDAGKIARL